MKYRILELNEMVDGARKVGWDGTFPVCSQYIAHRMGYVMRRYSKLKKAGKMEDGDSISVGTKMDERWSRMLVAHIMARHILYKEYNFDSVIDDIANEDTEKSRNIKYYAYELMMPKDFIYYLLTERKQTNRMILTNTFGVPEEVFDERIEQLGINLNEYREVALNDYRSV